MTNVLQGKVATGLRCGGTFNDDLAAFITDLLLSPVAYLGFVQGGHEVEAPKPPKRETLKASRGKTTKALMG